jgi:hypothetical protein
LLYVWSEGSTTKDINVTTPNTYCVTITDGFGCKKTECFEVKASTSTTDLLTETSVTIYPNPVEAFLTISTSNGLQLEKIRLMDDKGRIIAEYQGDVKIISMAQLPSAVYLLECSTKSGKIIKKVVKK